MNKIIPRVILLAMSLIILSQFASAAQCWEYDDDQTNCEAQTDCQWREDPWGSWCEEKGCWNFWDQGSCTNSMNTINKSCSWRSGSSGWCAEQGCWILDGTNQTACENNSWGLECTWDDDVDEWGNPCMGPPEKQCWTHSTQAACENITGCNWGLCFEKSCWDYSDSDQTTCEAQVGSNGMTCVWEVREWGTECMEGGCWNYDDISTCQSNNCAWDGSCMEPWCGTFSGENASYCVNNTANRSCEWDANANWCNDKGCWNYGGDSSTCNDAPGCVWETHDGGWCEEQWCWNWDGNQAGCENSSLHPGLSCVYDNSGGWCYENVTAKSCGSITEERDCMDTFYCWWDHNALTCNDPEAGKETEFVEWNPGCFLFDMDQAICENTTGCYWNSPGCENNASIIPTNELNCTLFNNQSVCNSIPALSTCCKWQAGSCVADRFDQSCRDQMQEPPEGAHYCEDYNSYTDQTLCEQIAGSPWFMPCQWDNSTERCEFKGDDIFGDGEKNIMKIDNEKNCEAAGGKWILDTYPSTNNASTAVRLSIGRCDYKFDEERNCNKECFACEYKSDKTNWSSSAKAKTACIESELGICGFTEDSNAPNGYGYCSPKDEFKQGLIGGDCDVDCGACTYMGDPSAASGKRPSDYCAASDAKCKWIADPAHPDDESYGRCASKSEKTCEDKCDKCYEEFVCQSTGGKQGDSSAAAVCEWSNGVCIYKSGASEMEICWDGIDNNGDNKMDCADSMCWSDPFCGGEFMFDDFGKDCFMFDDQTSCESEGCAWINENWGSWCDMPGAVCWKKDGTNQSYCEQNNTCEWHSGFGGFCEQDWDMGGVANACFSADNESACSALSSQNCTWIIDDWCQESGGWCETNGSWFAENPNVAWYDCWQHNTDSDCTNRDECQWQQDPWCATQGANAGFCDHVSFTCWQYDDNQSICENASNSEWCIWKEDHHSPQGGWCEGKMMSGESGSCWDSNTESACTNASGCTWMSGFCDPPGFGGDMMPGMSGGGPDDMGMGGFGMQCFQYDGAQSACENQTGCGWFNEPHPFCDINFENSCPQYTYNQSLCETIPSCMWNSQMNFCDEKPFECFWNQTLKNNFTLCDAHPLCFNNNNDCQPIGFNATTEQQCNNYNSTFFRWVTGWCNPAMAAEFFKGIDMGAPPTPLGTDPDDTAIEDEVDITGFGMKDMGEAYGFGITVDDPTNSAGCNDIKMMNGMGTGTNRTKFYWYLDTDGNTTNNCALNQNSSETGYEFYIKNEWSYDTTSGSVTESPAVYRCSEGSWILAEIRVSSERHLMCDLVGGAMVAIDKGELEKFPSLYTSGVDLRVSVASADKNHNITTPSDEASPGWVTPGSQDFEIPDLYSYETDWTKKAKKEGSDKGFIDYGEDADCWTSEGCEDYSCKGHPYCVENSLGVEAAGYTDTRIPKVIGVIKETYPDSAFLAYFTDKPANGTLMFYNNDSTCSQAGLTDTIYDIGILSNNSRNHKLWHIAEIYNDNGVESLNTSLSTSTTYYYRLAVCDDNGKCGTSKCSNFTTPDSLDDCSFCKYVSRIKAPTGWDVYYDIDQDGTYEHHQGGILNNSKDGMFTNYTIGRKANILMNTTDGTAHLEFLNVTLTKTGMSPKIRDIESSGALKEGTTTTSAGATIGYVGMIDETRDKIINNLYPRTCRVKIPGTGTCSALWHCDSEGDNCVDRTSEATLINTTSSACIWQIPYCEFSIWAGGQPGTVATPSSPGGGSSSPSSGGGIASGATQSIKAAHYFNIITVGEETTMKVNSENMAITKNTFKLNKQAQKATVTIRKVENKTELPKELENAYEYMEITLDNILSEDVDGATLEFKVSNTWLTQNNIESISLMRYTGSWTELPTQLISSDENYSHYRSETPGFSFFAVVGKASPQERSTQQIAEETTETVQVAEEIQQPQAEETAGETVTPLLQTPEQPSGSKAKTWIISIAIIALTISLITIITGIVKKKKK